MTVLESGSHFAGYRVIAPLGAGGMGQVYLVEHPHLLRHEALKIISLTAATNPDFQQRFTNEARTVATLHHPGIINIHHYGIDNGTPWFTMTYLDGADLTQAHCTDTEIAHITTRAATALDYAHRHHVTHRDVKPHNIMITREPDGQIDQVVLLDFGIAKLADATSHTATSAFIGTLAYSAPELLDGHDATPTTDQYALAATTYELLTGTPPFNKPTATALLAAILSQPAPPISTHRPDLTPLDPIFTRALAKDPTQRFPDCHTLATTIEQAIAQLPPGSRRPPAADPSSQPAVDIHATTRDAAPAPRWRRRRILLSALITAIVAVIAIATTLVVLNHDDTTNPTDPPIADDITSLSVGNHSACVIKARELYCWGGNEHGELGNGTVNSRNYAAKVPGLTDVTDVAVSTFDVCAIASAKVYCWGTLDKILTPQEVPSLTNATNVVVSSGSYCAIADSFLYCWGFNYDAQLADGTRETRTAPTKVERLAAVTAVSIGDETGCAISRGDLYCWGRNSKGQIGDGTTTEQLTPVPAKLDFPGMVSVGDKSVCAVRLDHDLYCWGHNYLGQVGDGGKIDRPVPIKVLGNVKDVAAGTPTCAVTMSGALLCWGDVTSKPRWGPRPFGNLRDVRSVAVSVANGCAIAGDDIYCWGLNDDGQLGDGTNRSSNTPVKVTFRQ